MKEMEQISIMELGPLCGITEHRILLVNPATGKGIGAIIPMQDLERLQSLDRNAEDRQRAARRGESWKGWEDDLMLDNELDEVDIAIQTQRTLKSIHERRRWIRKIAAARGEQ